MDEEEYIPEVEKETEELEEPEPSSEPEETDVEDVKPKRIYKLTPEQIEQRKINLAKGREKQRQKRLIKEEYKKSKKDAENQELEIMMEKTKLNKQKVQIEKDLEQNKLSKQIKNLEKMILDLKRGNQDDFVKESIKTNYENQKNNYKELEKQKQLDEMRKQLFGIF